MSDAQSVPPIVPGPVVPGSGKKGCLKAAGIGCGVLLLLVILFFVGVTIFFNRNKEVMVQGAEQGAQFGSGTDEAGCVAEGKRRAGAATGIKDQMVVGSFTRVCLEHARSTAGFCTGVPAPTSIGATKVWREKQCGNDVTCPGVISVVQTYCVSGAPKRLERTGAPPAATGPQTPVPDSNTF